MACPDCDRCVTGGGATGVVDAGLCGAHAGEPIQECVLALAEGTKVSEPAGVIPIYPTRAQINHRVAEPHLKSKLTPDRRHWIQYPCGIKGGES